LDTDVPEQELDRLQLATTLVAQAGARPPKVVGCDIAKVAGGASLFYNAPDDLGTETVGGNPSRFVDCAEDRAFRNLRFRHPGA
jgi:hypothetical protein